MRVLWSPRAIECAREAAEYIARDRPRTAGAWARRLRKVVGRLAEFPQRGRVVPELERENVRELIYRNYRVIYRVSEKEDLILTVRHGSRLLDVDEVVQP